MTSRALVILFTGGEVSTDSLIAIKRLLNLDDTANAQHVQITAFDPKDIAEIALKAAVETVQDKAVKVVVRQETESELDRAIKVIVNTFGNNCKVKNVLPVPVISSYLNNDEVKQAFQIVNNNSDVELSLNQTYHKSKISRPFIQLIRTIVENF